MYEDLPEYPILYRYLDQQYVDQFFNDGSLIINTLKNYQKMEGDIRQDPEEGLGHFVTELNEKGLQADESGIILSIQNPDPNLKREKIPEVKVDAGNHFILSTSDEKNKELLERFEVDSLFAINDVVQFSNEIALEIHKQYELLLRRIRKVDYKDDKKMPKDLMDMFSWSVFQKSTRYKIEKEWRVMFFPKCAIHFPIIIKCPDAIQYCDRVDVTQLQ